LLQLINDQALLTRLAPRAPPRVPEPVELRIDLVEVAPPDDNPLPSGKCIPRRYAMLGWLECSTVSPLNLTDLLAEVVRLVQQAADSLLLGCGVSTTGSGKRLGRLGGSAVEVDTVGPQRFEDVRPEVLAGDRHSWRIDPPHVAVKWKRRGEGPIGTHEATIIAHTYQTTLIGAVVARNIKLADWPDPERFGQPVHLVLRASGRDRNGHHNGDCLIWKAFD